jgi:hypothetical protein
MRYRIRIESDARKDIQSAISWYNQQKKGLGKYETLKQVQGDGIIRDDVIN